ncbi:MAG: phosphotransferase [Steroidobacteraceae bacterium]|jgi:Ser/Thr protein kinase RdoA (MazF antagonist)
MGATGGETMSAGNVGEGSNLAPVLSAPSHSSSLEEISQFIRSHYGVAGTLAKLGSERDENYCISLINGDQRLFKLTHALEDPALVDFQTQALMHLARVAPDLPLPRLIPSLSGDIQTSAVGSDGRTRRARMFTFLAGAPLSGFPRSAAQAGGLGMLAGRLDAALASFHHPAAGHEFLWDIQHALRTRELLTHTRSAADRELCERTLGRFERGLARELASFRTQVIHNDLNPHNLLVDPMHPDELTGIIDFGDMVLAPLIDEVAVASAYLLTASAAALGTVPEFVAAYHSIVPLRAEEIAALPQLIALRHAITILITNWRAARYPDNRDYILRNQHHAIAGIQKLCSLAESAAHERLLGACAKVRP